MADKLRTFLAVTWPSLNTQKPPFFVASVLKHGKLENPTAIYQKLSMNSWLLISQRLKDGKKLEKSSSWRHGCDRPTSIRKKRFDRARELISATSDRVRDWSVAPPWPGNSLNLMDSLMEKSLVSCICIYLFLFIFIYNYLDLFRFI